MNVIIGTGLAAVRAAETLRESGSSAPIVMVGAERALPYDRPPLSKELLRGEIAIEETRIHDEAFYREHEIELVLGSAACRLDLRDRKVELENGRQLAFGQLLVATGAAPRRLGVPGEQLDNVLGLRTADDALRLKTALAGASKVVIVGAGLIGLEVASAARAAGKEVTILEASKQPLSRFFRGAEIASAIAELHRDHGAVVRTSTTVVELRGGSGSGSGSGGGGQVGEVVLSTGDRLPADLVVTAVGVVPSIEWLLGSGLRLDDGIVVDERLRSEVPGVFAAGDVARAFQPAYGRHVRFESYGGAHEHGVVAGRAMAGVPGVASVVPGAGSEQYGVRMQIIGEARDAEEVVIHGSVAERSFVAYFLRQARVEGAFLMDRPRDAPAARKLVLARARLDEKVNRSASVV